MKLYRLEAVFLSDENAQSVPICVVIYFPVIPYFQDGDQNGTHGIKLNLTEIHRFL
jgi:hypothetical protein